MKHFNSFLTWAVLVLAISSIVSSCSPKDSTDSKDERSGMSLHTDNLTGCQYLGKFFGGVIPRTDKEGKQICQTNSTNY